MIVRPLAPRALDERLGFLVWGVEPGAVVLVGRTYDEVHMIAQLDRPGPAA